MRERHGIEQLLEWVAPVAEEVGAAPFLGVPEQAALDLGLTLGQHPAAFGQTGHPDLELLAARRHGAAALGQIAPRRGGLF